MQQKIIRHVGQHADDIEKLTDIAEEIIKRLKGERVSILLFDTTTLYFESFSEDELRTFGFSKNCKFKETQVVFALVTTMVGLPITYEMFPANKHGSWEK